MFQSPIKLENGIVTESAEHSSFILTPENERALTMMGQFGCDQESKNCAIVGVVAPGPIYLQNSQAINIKTDNDKSFSQSPISNKNNLHKSAKIFLERKRGKVKVRSAMQKKMNQEKLKESPGDVSTLRDQLQMGYANTIHASRSNSAEGDQKKACT